MAEFLMFEDADESLHNATQTRDLANSTLPLYKKITSNLGADRFREGRTVCFT